MIEIIARAVKDRQSGMLRVFLLLGASCQVSCTPYWYDGEFAVLNGDPATTITRSDKNLGDCYRVFTAAPTVYEIARPGYTLRLAHGNRYWPEFYFLAESTEQAPLEIIGTEIVPVDYPWSADHRRLEEARGLQLSHKSLRLDYVQSTAITVAILDPRWNILGIEKLKYEIKDVNCFGVDSL